VITDVLCKEAYFSTTPFFYDIRLEICAYTCCYPRFSWPAVLANVSVPHYTSFAMVSLIWLDQSYERNHCKGSTTWYTDISKNSWSWKSRITACVSTNYYLQYSRKQLNLKQNDKIDRSQHKNRYIKDYDWLLQGCGHQCINCMIGYCRDVDTDVLTVWFFIVLVWTLVY